MTPKELATAIVEKIELLIHEYDYNKAVEIIESMLREAMDEAMERGCDIAAESLEAVKEALIKDARAEALAKAARVANKHVCQDKLHYGTTMCQCKYEIAEAICSLAK